MRTLCDGPILVQIGGGGDDVHLRVRDGSIARFCFATADLEQVLLGVPIQLSAAGESVFLFRQGDAIRVVFNVVGHDRSLCAFPAGDLEDALTEVRAGRIG